MVGGERVLVAVPRFASGWSEEGRKMTVAGGGWSLGSWEGRAPAAEPVAALLSGAGLGEVSMSPAIHAELWSSMAQRLPCFSFSGLTGSGCGALACAADAGPWLAACSQEVRMTAAMQGTDLQSLSAIEAAGYPRTIPSDAIQSPVLADLRRGRRSENSFLAAYVAARARAGGLKTPVTTAFDYLLREIEGGRRSPAPENLREMKRRIEEEEGMSLS